MSQLLRIAALILGSTLVPVAGADLSVPGCHAPSGGVLVSEPVFARGALRAGRLDLNLHVLLPTSATPLACPVEEECEATGKISAPDAPDGITIAMWAIASIGAWQAARGGRWWALAVPEWYHTGGPRQTGCALPLVLDRDAWPMEAIVRPLFLRVTRMRQTQTPAWRPATACPPAPAGPRAPPR